MSLSAVRHFIVLSVIVGLSPSNALSSPESWKALQQEGDTALSVNNYGLADRSLNQALPEAEAFGPGDMRLAQTLHSLATLYSTRGSFTKAEPLYERELRVKEKALGPEHPEVVACVGKLAQFYLNHDSPAKAERLTNLLLTFADRKVKEQDGLKTNFGKLDQVYVKSADYSEARTILQKLEETTQRANATQGLELATTLDSLGHLYKDRRRFDLAEKMYKRAFSFREHTLPPGHLALAYSYENLANLYVAQGKNAEAEPYFKQSLEVTEKTLQPGRPELYRRLDELAQAHLSMGQTAEAVSLYQRALKVMENAKGGNPDVGKASFSLGMLYIKEGHYGQAEPLLKRALQISESTNGPQHASVAPILDGYAEALEKMNKTGEAAKMRARAKVIRGTTVVQKTDLGSDF